VIAGGVHPADECDGLADVGLAEFVAVVGTHGEKNYSFNHRWTG
jgi:hypothetical protein